VNAPTIHASAVLLGARAVLVRGASGAGKSRLVFDLIEASARGRLAFARLVADDRVHVEAVHDRVIVRPPATLAGLLEVRGLGILQLPFEPMAAVGLVVDLGVAAPRLPDPAHRRAEVAGVTVRRLAVARGCDPLPLVLAAAAHPFTTDVPDRGRWSPASWPANVPLPCGLATSVAW
jgi:hypothetical protein